MHTVKLTPLLLSLAAGIGVHAEISYDFNVSQADFNANFTTIGTSFDGEWENGIVAGDGVGGAGSGFLDTTPNEQTAFWGSSVGQFSGSGETLWTSTYFRMRDDQTSNSSGSAKAGFQTNNTQQLGGGGTYAFATVARTAADTFNLAVTHRNNGNLQTKTDAISFGDITDNDWYQLRIDLNTTSSTDISATVTLYGWGADGVTGGSVLDTFTTNLDASAGNNMSTMFNTDIYAGFNARTINGGGARADQVDNFVVIPEPGSLALIGIAALALMLIRKRIR